MSKQNVQINVSVTFRRTEPTDALKAYATEKVTNCLQKFVNRQADVSIVLSVDKRDHSAEVKILSKGYDLAGKAVTEDLYSAIDKVVDTLDTQLRKTKGKQIGKKHQAMHP